MPRWTNEQSQAINARGSNLLVSAAAGSGKTAVLVERIIKLVTEDLIDIDKLLIVTFTKAAAGEMRERIVKAITEKIDNKTGDEEHLRKQLTILNKASITTIHSYCKNEVIKNFHILGIILGFFGLGILMKAIYTGLTTFTDSRAAAVMYGIISVQLIFLAEGPIAGHLIFLISALLPFAVFAILRRIAMALKLGR